ncbi:MAG TPA: TMEM175 family protein [Cytophagaceae bacterium]|jgi:uncharacterized membrane protein
MEKETGRIEAFSDGVFAIAITLLVLELIIPAQENLDNSSLLMLLKKHWPSYLAFTTSFFSILIMWMNHHEMFRHIHTVTRPVIFANGLLLLLVTAVPFPTSLIAQYIQTPAANMAAAVYSGTFVVINISFNLLWYTATKNGCLKKGVDIKTINEFKGLYLIGLPAYLAAFVVAFFHAGLSIMICMVLWLYWTFTIKLNK